MIHKILMRITRNRPMKTIEIRGEGYLERYYMGQRKGRQYWLHRFLRQDAERHVHSHPWRATSIVICGWYREQVESGLRQIGRRSFPRYVFRERWPWSRQRIGPSYEHRIVDVRPDTWTLMIVEPQRLPFWYFIDDDGSRTAMTTSDVDWWKSAEVRGGGVK